DLRPDRPRRRGARRGRPRRRRRRARRARPCARPPDHRPVGHRGRAAPLLRSPPDLLERPARHPPVRRPTMAEIDIFNDRYEHTGTMDKKAAHAQGQWHRTFSALAFNPTTRRVVLQKKTPDRYVFDRPDYADITVGGHYLAGETIPQGIREVHEELGLPVTYTDLHPIGIRQTAVTLAPDYLEREFQH